MWSSHINGKSYFRRNDKGNARSNMETECSLAQEYTLQNSILASMALILFLFAIKCHSRTAVTSANVAVLAV